MRRDGGSGAYPVDSPPPHATATLGAGRSSSPDMRRLPAILCAVLAVGIAAPAAQAATAIVLRGAGYGHGVGMSQYGTLGFSQHGWDYRRILGYYYKGTAISRLTSDPSVRVLLRSGHTRYMVRGAASSGALRLDPQETYTAVLSGDRIVLRRGDKDLGSVAGTLRLAAPSGGRYVIKIRTAPCPTPNPGPGCGLSCESQRCTHRPVHQRQQEFR